MFISKRLREPLQPGGQEAVQITQPLAEKFVLHGKDNYIIRVLKEWWVILLTKSYRDSSGPRAYNAQMEIWEIQRELRRGEMVQGVRAETRDDLS